MKLFYFPGACSLAPHIALRQAGLPFDIERVDLKSKQTESGADFLAINPKGYVPALVLDGGQTITENLAVLDWIVGQSPSLGIDGPLGRTRLLETLAYISTEIHKSFKPFFTAGSDEEKARARALIDKRLQLPAEQMRGPYLFGSQPTVADCYLFVMLLWADRFGLPIPPRLLGLRDQMLKRPTVQATMQAEGLTRELARSA